MTGIVCLIISAVCLFVAMERYTTNASNVRAMNAMNKRSEQRMNNFQLQHFPQHFQEPVNSSAHMVPAVPTVSKYTFVFAIISGVVGSILLKKSKHHKSYLNSCVKDSI